MGHGERIFVAGGTGTAGRAYARTLAARGYEVTASARDQSAGDALAELGIEPVAADLADRAATADAMEGANTVVVALLGRERTPPPRRRRSLATSSTLRFGWAPTGSSTRRCSQPTKQPGFLTSR